MFCNGMELCRPGEAGADAVGCVAGEAPCTTGQSCVEAEERCRSDCSAMPDADGDDREAVECGGDDCDDSDPQVYTGAPEICDAEGRDEDCDPNTLSPAAQTDGDGDGYVDSACCNRQPTGAVRCGLDCDDAQPSANPGHPETCDGIDNDCDGEVDERVQTTYYADTDGDLYGDPASTAEGCSQPDGYVGNDDDCADDAEGVHPGAAESCNGLDDDCDGMLDEAVSPAPATPEHCGGCGLACPSGFECDVDMCVDRAVEVAAGYGFVAVRGQSGQIYIWDTGNLWTTSVTFPDVDDAVDIAAAYATLCFARATGEVWCWGEDPRTGEVRRTPERIGSIGDATSVSVGAGHACATGAAGSLYCWGRNESGQLGAGDTAEYPSVVTVSGLAAAVDEVVAGFEHTCALLSNAQVYCWGAGERGSLGHGDFADSLVPVRAGSIEASTLGGNGKTVCAGAGQTRCWGFSAFGEAGSSEPAINTPNVVADFPFSVTTIASSFAAIVVQGDPICAGCTCWAYSGHSCAVTASDRLYCWGDNSSGQLGDGTRTSRHAAAEADGFAGVPTSIAAGLDSRPACGVSPGVFTCATNESGAVYCWGSNAGQLFQSGDESDRLVPTRVSGFPVRVPPASP